MPELNSFLKLLDPQLTKLIASAPAMPLDDSGIDDSTAKALDEWLKRQYSIPQSCVAGLWILAGDLERSHAISQELETEDGSYWHGIMHRREGDYSNAKYWMRRTGQHPVTAELKRQIPEYRDALSFVDFVEHAMREQPQSKVDASRIQWLEWQLLFEHCLAESR